MLTLFEALSLLLYVNAVLVIVLLIFEERDPSTTLAWALTLILFPGVGLVLYLLIGRNWREIGRRDRKLATAERLAREAMSPLYALYAEEAREFERTGPRLYARLIDSLRIQARSQPLPCEDFELFESGQAKFARLLQDIRSARHHVHLEYFIWEQDDLTGEVCAALAAKVAEGVEVRVLYDWVGSLPYGKRQLRALEQAGAQVHADAAHWSKANYRNHRKVAVIDGRIGYTGGMNMGKEYVDGRPRYRSWRDSHVRFTGPLVAELQRMFTQRWYRTVEEPLFAENYFPSLSLARPDSAIWAQIAYSGPESEWHSVRNAFLLAIYGAEKQLLIQSPYFVPDESVGNAMDVQSLAGVDVRFMMTAVPDKAIPWYAAFSYLDEVVEAGGRVFQYEAGFFHSKTMAVDGVLAVVGTTNFDIRSFMLHDELSVFIYDPRIAALVEERFDLDCRFSREITAADFDAFPLHRRFAHAAARLASRLL